MKIADPFLPPQEQRRACAVRAHGVAALRPPKIAPPACLPAEPSNRPSGSDAGHPEQRTRRSFWPRLGRMNPVFKFQVSSFKFPFTIRHVTTRSQAFTLLELLVVIAIIMIVSSVLIASYFGMIRGSSYAATEKNVFNALTLARQRACIDGIRVYVMFQSSNDFVLVRSAGRVTSVAPGSLSDAYADISTAISHVKIYNMDSNGMATVDSITPTINTTITDPITGAPYSPGRKELKFAVSALTPLNCFAAGDHYGLEVYQSQRLPKGFYCKVTRVDDPAATVNETPTASNMLKVIFEPDGRRGAGSITKITVYEKIIGEAEPRNQVTFTINHEGTIKVEAIGFPG